MQSNTPTISKLSTTLKDLKQKYSNVSNSSQKQYNELLLISPQATKLEKELLQSLEISSVTELFNWIISYYNSLNIWSSNQDLITIGNIIYFLLSENYLSKQIVKSDISKTSDIWLRHWTTIISYHQSKDLLADSEDLVYKNLTGISHLLRNWVRIYSLRFSDVKERISSKISEDSIISKLIFLNIFPNESLYSYKELIPIFFEYFKTLPEHREDYFQLLLLSFTPRIHNGEYPVFFAKVTEHWLMNPDFKWSHNMILYILMHPNKTIIEDVKKIIESSSYISKLNQKKNFKYVKELTWMFDKNTSVYLTHVEEILRNWIETSDYLQCFNIINNFPFKDTIDKAIIWNLINIFPYENTSHIKELILLVPDEYNNIVRNYWDNNKLKECLKWVHSLGKGLKLESSLYNELKLEAKKRYIRYKCMECTDNWDALFDYIVYDNILFNFAFEFFFSRYQKDFEGNEEHKFSGKISQKWYKILQLFQWKRFQYGLFLTKSNVKFWEKVLKKDDLKTIIKSKDEFKPRTENCYTLTLSSQRVIMIDTIEKWLDCFDLGFHNTGYIGVDSEWKQNETVFDKPVNSILQIANYNEDVIGIIDLITLKKNRQFFHEFRNLFSQRTFIGYAFNKSDMDNLPKEMVDVFKTCNVIDIVDWYQKKFNEKAPSLSAIVAKVYGKPLCKYEQCSNWDVRPWRKSQRHYAALDAVICVKLYKTLK